jgi:voltage-gated potassium channel
VTAARTQPLSLRRRVYLALNPEDGLTLTTRLLVLLIIFATLVTVIETEPILVRGREPVFHALELAFALLFSAEYAARIWSAPEGPCSRLRYALSPWSIVDLVVIVASILTLAGAELMLLRMLRMVRLAKLARYSPALAMLQRAVRSRASHLLASFSLALVFLLVSATIMYGVEGPHQPEQFGSIPRALWWSVATMTTVGYGDVVPATALGRVIAGFIAIAGIVLVAIPTGIMAAAFSDELLAAQQDRED